MSMTAFIPLLIASVTGSLVSKFFHMDDILLSVDNLDDFSTSDFPFFLIVSVLSALTSTYFTRTSYYVEGLMAKLKNPFVKAILGGLLLGAIIIVFPPIYGDGFEFIKEVKNNFSQRHFKTEFDPIRSEVRLIFNHTAFVHA